MACRSTVTSWWQLILGAPGVLQTIPSLALLVFLIPVFHLGAGSAIVALFLYSLLPIVRNTLSGLASIPAPLQEAAASLGLPGHVRLLRIEPTHQSRFSRLVAASPLPRVWLRLRDVDVPSQFGRLVERRREFARPALCLAAAFSRPVLSPQSASAIVAASSASAGFSP